MAWKKVVDIIPSNFFQTRILPDDKYAVAQRKVLIRIVGNRRIHRGMPNPPRSPTLRSPPNMVFVPIPLSRRKLRGGMSCKFGLAKPLSKGVSGS